MRTAETSKNICAVPCAALRRVYNRTHCVHRYEMASRINQRTCRAQGWDNAVPICEGTIS